MKTKTITFLFVIIAFFLAGTILISKKFSTDKSNKLSRAKIITPKSSESGESDVSKKLSSSEAEKYETFVPLATGETLISTLTIDFNNDGYDDEIIVVRVNTAQNLYIVPGIYDPESGNYTRLSPIPTTFTRTRTFSYTGMDILGNHTTALIYQGVDDSGNYIMQVFTCKDEKGTCEVSRIANFETDGTVFIAQSDRGEDYELSLSNAAPFGIWVYQSEKDEIPEGEEKPKTIPNQIQSYYTWRPESQHYELENEIKVTAGRLAATELSKIQDGTEETFASFLNGLWYKISNTDGNIRYLFFDYANHEIIQFYADIQEIYEWENSKLMHNGIYISTVNADIMNLHRRFNISLTAIDEIKLTLRDDVNLIIKENTMWDGNYKKMSSQTPFETAKINNIEHCVQELQKGPGWTSADTLVNITFSDSIYILQTNSFTETGVFTGSIIGDYNVIQFRSDSSDPFMGDSYAVEFGTKTVTETIKKKTVEKVVTDYDTILFTPVKITPTDCFTTDGRSFTFTR